MHISEEQICESRFGFSLIRDTFGLVISVAAGNQVTSQLLILIFFAQFILFSFFF